MNKTIKAKEAARDAHRAASDLFKKSGNDAAVRLHQALASFHQKEADRAALKE